MKEIPAYLVFVFRNFVWSVCNCNIKAPLKKMNIETTSDISALAPLVSFRNPRNRLLLKKIVILIVIKTACDLQTGV